MQTARNQYPVTANLFYGHHFLYSHQAKILQYMTATRIFNVTINTFYVRRLEVNRASLVH